MLRAAGDAFSAGADVSIFAGLDHDAAAELMNQALSLIAAIEDIQVPTVALLHGRCFAGALEVALACDLIWAAAGTQIGQVEAVIGAFPFAGGTQRLASRIGAARAAQIVYAASIHPAEELAGWGLVSQVTAPERLLPDGSGLCRAPRERSDARSPGNQARPACVAIRRRVRGRRGDAL